ncbi:peptidoglycan editing factor PgeF [Alcaligenaceae bacterium B3P038]|nr:peptidoglycan editing factor PgeF [Alcaligenaceae bacterium B3P038]
MSEGHLQSDLAALLHPAGDPIGAGDLAGPAWPGLRIFTTGRDGGVSKPPYDTFNVGAHVGDAPDAVAANRLALRRRLPGEPLWLEQVHGIAVVDADTAASNAAANTTGTTNAAGTAKTTGTKNTTGTTDSTSTAHTVPTADAAFTREPCRVLAIMTADCLPVVIAATDGSIVGAAHAGWRGLAAGVLEALLTAMRAAAPDAPGWRAWIGPAIGPDAFEVGDEVRQAFVAPPDGAIAPEMSAASQLAFSAKAEAPGKWLADLPLLAEQRLRRAGVTVVVQSGACTVTDRARFFSYRRDGQCGRMVTLAWRSHP